MIKKKIIRGTHLTLKAVIYSLVPIVFLLIVTANSAVLFGVRSYVVQTGSMEPKIPVGSIIFSVPQKTYQLGDVVLFRDEQERTISHRIDQSFIKNGKVIFRTKGDANNGPDSNLVPESIILGREFFLIPSAGKISGVIKTIPGFLILLGLPTLLFIAFELKNIKTEMEKDIEKKIKEKMGVAIQYES